MKLTIIETGLVPAAIRADWPDYPAMFAALLAPAAPDMTFETISIPRGDPLPDPADLNAFLITGSPAGVYDPEPWMPGLMDFIRWAAAAGTPGVGICFGHQAMAQAMGGLVTKAPQGWGLGRHSYRLSNLPEWMKNESDTLSLAVSHQDQVITPPVGARVIAQSDFTPFAGLFYETAPFLSFQAHPEFSAAYALALHTSRIGRPLSQQQVARAAETLSEPLDSEQVAGWIAAHFVRMKAK